ncbi:hypothetical protein CR513_17498, partial [Mucuna pruriens]
MPQQARSVPLPFPNRTSQQEKPSKGCLSPSRESQSRRSHPGQINALSNRPTLQPSNIKEQSSPSVVPQSDKLN